MYKIPLDKFPMLDWTSSEASYGAGYNWTAGAFNPVTRTGPIDTLGSLLGNNRNRQLTLGLDFSKLYKKSKFLQSVETPPKPKAKTDDKNKKTDKNDKKTNNKPEIPADSLKPKDSKVRNLTILKAIVRPLLLIKRVNLTYNVTEQTIFPGFSRTPRFFGFDENWDAPGLPFVLGSQNSNIKDKAIRGADSTQQWLATGVTLNNPFTQTRREDLKISANIEPLPDFRIQVDMVRSRQGNYTEIFRNVIDTVTFIKTPQSLNPVRTGNYTVSFVAFLTAFRKDNSQNESGTFQNFSEYRAIIAARLRALNPNYNPNNPETPDYAQNSQDVLIPAFLAAYSGRDPDKVSLSPFPKIPLPNWQIDYRGLSKIGFLKKTFQSIELKHSYASNFTVSNYTTSLVYNDTELFSLNKTEFEYAIPDSVNAQNEFIPVYVIGQVNISEKFQPLIGVNLRTTKNLSFRLDYNQDRDLSLNLSNAQLAEIRNKSVVMSVSYTRANLKLPFRSNGKQIVLKNDVDFRMDVTVRDTRTVQRKIDEDAVVTGGNLNFQLRPVISYMVNKQLSFQFYFEKNINAPRVSSSFRRTVTTGGVQLRYNITP
jgi:cell surface protein SprA